MQLPFPQQASPQPERIGVGIDTSRYGHYATFLRPDGQPAAAELPFAESHQGYAAFRQRLEGIANKYSPVHFVIRVDVAGQYADNLLHFLQDLATTGARLDRALAPVTWSISCGDPQRNKNYRAALFGSKKTDPVEARAAARFAVNERPVSMVPLTPQLRVLRQIAGRLQSTVKQRTRLINQLHHLLAQAFPELALLVQNVARSWVLQLVHRYPTAQLLARASADDLANIPHLPEHLIASLLEHARTSIASLTGPAIEALLRDQVRQLRDCNTRKKRLEKLLIQAYRDLPKANHLDTIPGLGQVTSAILTAFMVDIERFATPNQLVAYFGAFPIEASSGIDRDGHPRCPRRYIMSRRGNDLVRRYLWMAALSAVRFNPAVRALYRRVIAKHPDHKAIAIGHAMRKLLHLAFAIWKSDQTFDPQHYSWHTPAHVEQEPLTDIPSSLTDMPSSADNQAAGHKPETKPATKVVTAAWTDTLAQISPADESSYLDFAHIKRQLSLARLLDHLGLAACLRGSGPQRRCPCPIHGAHARSRTFSVNLDDNVFQCFHAACGKKGDVIDLWASVRSMSLRRAALDLVQIFHLEPAPRTEKRNG